MGCNYKQWSRFLKMMIFTLRQCAKKISRIVLLDTNLIVALVVDLTEREEIGNHKLTRDYTPENFDLLFDTLNKNQELGVTSQAVAEYSNLIRQANLSES